MRNTIAILTVSFLCVLLVPCTARAVEKGEFINTWYYGFGLGTGFDESWEIGASSESFDDRLASTDKWPKTSLNFKVGKTLDRNNLLGFDMTALWQRGESGAGDANYWIINYFVMWTHFPTQEGLFIRLGGGVSTIGISADSVYGGGVLAGIGYSFWVNEQYDMTVTLDHSRQLYDARGEPEKSQFTSVYIGFDMYK